MKALVILSLVLAVSCTGAAIAGLRDRRRRERRRYALGPARNAYGLPVAGQPLNDPVSGRR